MKTKALMIPAMMVLVASAMGQAVQGEVQASQPVAAMVTSRDLVERGKELDGKELVFEGEAIGDPMRRGDHSWVNVLDSNAAMGVWMTNEAAGGITRFGSYRTSGDRLRVRGVFRRACPDHGGDMDIHANSIEIVARGTDSSHPVERSELSLLPGVLVLSLVLFVVWRRREASIKRGKSLHPDT